MNSAKSWHSPKVLPSLGSETEKNKSLVLRVLIKFICIDDPKLGTVLDEI